MHNPDEKEIQKFFESKAAIILGACGTIGKNIARQLLQYKPSRLRLFDSDDTSLTELNDELVDMDEHGALRVLYGDIRDKERLVRAFEDIDYVFHCAALKHVEIGEYNPREIVRTNIDGTQNVIDAALYNEVHKVVFTSSDKAVNPTSTMGASKLLGERLIIAANNVRGFRRTMFSAVRFGNVLGSRGSVIPRFKKRVRNNLDLMVTDPNMTRFVLPIPDAVNLTIKSMVISNGGEIFVLKMPSLVLQDLLDHFVEFVWMKTGTKPEVKVIGSFPGEKNYEELMSEDEVARAIEEDDMYIILPHIAEILDWHDKKTQERMGNLKSKVYNSRFATPMSSQDLKDLIDKLKVFEES